MNEEDVMNVMKPMQPVLDKRGEPQRQQGGMR